MEKPNLDKEVRFILSQINSHFQALSQFGDNPESGRATIESEREEKETEAHSPFLSSCYIIISFLLLSNIDISFNLKVICISRMFFAILRCSFFS